MTLQQLRIMSLCEKFLLSFLFLNHCHFTGTSERDEGKNVENVFSENLILSFLLILVEPQPTAVSASSFMFCWNKFNLFQDYFVKNSLSLSLYLVRFSTLISNEVTRDPLSEVFRRALNLWATTRCMLVNRFIFSHFTLTRNTYN